MRALIPEFNNVILRLAPAFEARATAPSTLAGLMSLETGAALPVWEGASDCTIYGDARVNHAFRAWHDATHRAGAFGFTLEGERATREAQARAVLQLYPRAPKAWLALLRAEIDGQAEFFAANGFFPADQFAFVREALHHA